MNTLIFRTIAPLLVAVMLVFSVFVLLRGHNEPGGGFIGGLIAASAIAIYGMATASARRGARCASIRWPSPASACCSRRSSGLLSLLADAAVPHRALACRFGESICGVDAVVFDIGVYFVVFGTMSADRAGARRRRGGRADGTASSPPSSACSSPPRSTCCCRAR